MFWSKNGKTAMATVERLVGFGEVVRVSVWDADGLIVRGVRPIGSPACVMDLVDRILAK